MKIITVCLPDTYVDGMEQLVEKNMYTSRSEIIRVAIRDLLLNELWSDHNRHEHAPLTRVSRPLSENEPCSVKER